MSELDEDDDLLPELPALGGREDDEPAGPEDLGLADEPIADEEVGLDDAAGFDDESPLFALELPPKAAVEDEDDVDAIPDDEVDGEDEYGWTDASEPASDEPWEAGVDFLGGETSPFDDGGEEGVEDPFEIGGADDDASHLPALRGYDPEDDAEDLALGADALIAATVRAFDEEKRALSASSLPRLDCELADLGGGAITCADARGWAGGDGVFKAVERCVPVALQGTPIAHLAALEDERLIVARAGGGALRSSDDRFVPCDPDGRTIEWVGRERGARVWATARGGALFRSDDAGASWAGPLLYAPTVAVATPDEGGVVALCAGQNAPAQVARSSDGGQRWAAFDAPPLAQGARFVAALGDSIAIACEDDPRGPHLSNDRGKSWARVPGLPRTGPIALVREAGGLSLYAVHHDEARDRAFVARHRPGGGDAHMVLELPSDAAIHALAVERSGERTILYAASDAGLFRVEIDPDRHGAST